MRGRITPTVGQYNNSPPRATVMVDDFDDFMSAPQARAFAARLLKAADAADVKYAEWKAQRKAQRKARRGGFVKSTAEKGRWGGQLAKITASQVQELRARYAQGRVTQKALGQEYGLKQAQVSEIIRRVAWVHVP
jgi:uncharacterized protein involved in exopolysaccharide biosynthesis